MSENKDIYKKVRIHKHTYAGGFGNVVVDPISTLIEELLVHPEIFTIEERKDILECYRQVMQISGQYEVLGYTLSEQLSRVKDKMIPTIKANCTLLEKTISQPRHFQENSLVEVLRWAIGKTPDICDKLSKIEEDDKGEKKVINLIKLVDDYFKEEKRIRNIKGLPSYDFAIYGRELSNTCIQIDPEGFKNSVLHSIIENTHKHAFNHENKNYDTIVSKKQRSNASTIQNKQVQIVFKKDNNDSNYITMTIENNGKPYTGDSDKIFDYGVGENTGIGLYSAKDFLIKNGATINMASTPDDEFTVHFIIKIPIYEQ